MLHKANQSYRVGVINFRERRRRTSAHDKSSTPNGDNVRNSNLTADRICGVVLSGGLHFDTFGAEFREMERGYRYDGENIDGLEFRKLYMTVWFNFGLVLNRKDRLMLRCYK